MALKLMYITNNPDVALIAESAGVDMIFVDMEYIGKTNRQGGMDSVQSHHTFKDIKNIRRVLTKAELLVRCNPIHVATNDYCSSEEEIDKIIECGADIIMLPYFKTVEEVKAFLGFVAGRTKTMLLLETPEAVDALDNVLKLSGIDYIHIGLNDLSLGYHKKFMFELLADGTVDILCATIRKAGIPFGFGGIASLGKGTILAEMIIKEHYRLESTCAILSRSFCDISKRTDLDDIKVLFNNGVEEIRKCEKQCESEFAPFIKNKKEIKKRIETILGDEE